MPYLVSENATIDGHRIAHGTHGMGEPVVLVHGTPSSSHIWRNVLPKRVEAGHEVYLFDLLGFGSSERPSDPAVDTSVSGQVPILEGLMAQWGLDQAHIVAHDIGGAVARRYSIFNPNMARSLTGVDPVSTKPGQLQRKPFPEHLQRERVVLPGPTCCGCCGSTKLAKLGEDVTETLEVIPRQCKVIQYVREKFTCRHCEAISQPPAPFHVIPRGFAGPSLLAMILFEKYDQHQPLNGQSERYAKEGVDLSLSTMADLVGTCTVVLRPLVNLIEAHVLDADRLHADDTPIRVLAKGKCAKATVWAYVHDDRPFGGPDPPKSA